MTYLLALYFRWKHRAWSWGLCMHSARKEREDIPPINSDKVAYGIIVVVAAIFLFGVLK